MSKDKKLKKAILKGDIKAINKCLKSSYFSKAADINSYDEEKNTPLNYAIEEGNIEVVEHLLTKGADVNKRIGLGKWTPLFYAVDLNKKQIVKLLLSYGAEIDQEVIGWGSPIEHAVYKKYNDIAELLLSSGADVKRSNKTLYSALTNNINLIPLLLSYGVPVNKSAESEGGYTPLGLAIHYINEDIRYKDIVSLFLKHGADVNMDIDSLYISVEHGYMDIIKLLLPHYSNVNKNIRGLGTVLCKASERGDIEIVKLLIDHGADVNKLSLGIYSPLCCAAEKGNWDIVKLLISKGADVNKDKGHRDSPLYNAIWRNRKDMVELFLSKGADPNSVNNNGETPLQLAVNKGQIDIIMLLLSFGAEKSKIDEKARKFINILTEPLHEFEKDITNISREKQYALSLDVETLEVIIMGIGTIMPVKGYDRIIEVSREVAKQALPVVKHIVNGDACIAEKNYDGAISEYMEAIKMEPACAIAHLAIGSAYYFKNDFVNALRWTKKAAELDPLNSRIQKNYEIAKSNFKEKQI